MPRLPSAFSAREVNQDGVHAAHGIEIGGHVVVVLDLCGGLLAFEFQALLHELLREGGPVDVRIGHLVGVHVARCAAKFGCERHAVEHLQLVVEALHEDIDLLAQMRRAGGLTVGLGQHRDVAPFFGHAFQFVDEVFQGGLHHQFVRLHHRERHGGVVDVLRGEAEVQKLLEFGQAEFVETAFQEVFHGFHVVVGLFFYLLDFQSVFNLELFVDGAEVVVVAVELLKLRQGQLAQGDVILHLYHYAIADEGKFGEKVVQLNGLGTVTPVDGRYCC